jgi:ribonuclease D
MEYVHNPDQTVRLARSLEGSPLLAADTEAAGYHRYHDRICLLQLSTRHETALVDTLAVADLTPLEPYFADPEIEIVFHDADYDLRLLSRDYGLGVRGLFDTKIAAQLLGEPAFGLGSLLEKFIGVKVEKKYQRADWAQRPLPPELLAYAAEDTRYLPPLRDTLKEALQAAGRLAWAEEEFRIEEQVHWTPAEDNGDAFLRLKGTRNLRPRQLAALRELYNWREAVAAERDRASFRILPNEALLGVAHELPEAMDALARVPQLPQPFVERYGAELLAAVERARGLPEDELPVRPRRPARRPPDPTFDALMDHLKAARDVAADQLGLDRGFLMPRSQLEEIARERPRSLDRMREIPGLRRWQVEALGGSLLRVLKR